jgi:hypothetical protein
MTSTLARLHPVSHHVDLGPATTTTGTAELNFGVPWTPAE